ncbi:PREDICTED: PBAN-type neuropeptides-like isoform X2 [Wasmannia auropunctata]|uniref:PBAN-type neuropeptides-like isoform X2 n=1 Tax=Wasmannia auropunctata TaxID=64793 RepID=UPI0005F0405C|nr:PREDICTED: PBAN-type neuropeptides-like isoform X2 [Wasmannia auropunctata]
MIVTGNPVSRAAAFCILAMLLCLGSRASGEYESRETNGGSSDGRTPNNDFSSCIEGKCIKRTPQDITNAMWFGPRLGKRHRSDEKQEVSPEIEVLANPLNGMGLAIITVPAARRQQKDDKKTEEKQQKKFTFIPRPGRESNEDLFYFGDAYEVDEDDRLLPPQFVPRLGRWLPGPPRLGRQLRNALWKL